MLKIILNILLVSNIIYAAPDFINDYRLKGLKYIESVLDMALEDSLYWSGFLKDYDTSLGYYSSIRYIILVEKDSKTFKLFRKDNISIQDTGVVTMNQLTDLNVLIGKNSGTKLREGDLTTPIGNYQLVKVKNNVDPFYGPLALVTSYPNNYDKLLHRTGSGIWIHGLPENVNRKNYTRGCVAIDNEQLVEVKKTIDIKRTTLIISNTELPEVPKYTIAMLMSKIYQWRNAWKYSNFKKYIQFYDKSFKRLNGRNLQQFAKRKKALFRKGEKKRIIFSDINIIPYPNIENQDMYRIIMHEDYRSSGGYKFVGTKELIVKLDKKLHMKILFED